ncbi:MAG TPA: glycosyltransferase [Rhodospirillales bacterium]|nr:glycosyltransferase [Rhodospirillales bacterium]
MAANDKIGGKVKLFGVEFSDMSTTYAWDKASSQGFKRITLFPSKNWEDIHPLRRMWKLMSCLLKIKAKHVFLINYSYPDTFLAAVLLRMMGKFPYIMMGSKFSDKDRSLWREALKSLLFFPYVGGVTSGAAHFEYLEFLGVRTDNFRTGLDTVSVQRVRDCSGSEPAPGGYVYERRHFTIIARMIPEKDLPTAINAYARYRELCLEHGVTPRDLVLCGDGPERGAIESMVREKNVPSVIFLGFGNEKEVCETLASTLALILPSVSETWGLVINEAVAMGVPVLCSDLCGARDDLVRSGVNGYSFAPGEVEGLANLMRMLSSDENEWRRLAQGSLRVAARADASRFADAVAEVLERRSKVPLAAGEAEDTRRLAETLGMRAAPPATDLGPASGREGEGLDRLDLVTPAAAPKGTGCVGGQSAARTGAAFPVNIHPI